MEHYTPKTNPVPEGLLTRNQGRKKGLTLKRNAVPVGFKINQLSHEGYFFYTEDSFRPKKKLSEKQIAILKAGRKKLRKIREEEYGYEYQSDEEE